MRLCLTSQRAFTGIHTAEPDGTCILPAGHDGDHDFVPDPIVVDTARIRYGLPTTTNLDVPAWVSAHYRRPEAAA